MGLGYALNCVLRMLRIFSRGLEPEVEGDDYLVIVAVEKRERSIYLKRWCRRWMPVNAVTPYKNCVPAAGVRIVMSENMQFVFIFCPVRL